MKDNLSGTYFFDTAPQLAPDALNNVLDIVFMRRQMFGLTENHVFSPGLVNIVRFGFNRTRGLVSQPGRALNPVAADTSLGIYPGFTAALLNVSGIANAYGLGGALGSPTPGTSFQFYDDLFMTRGNHSLKYGLAFERLQSNEGARLRINGSVQFSSLANFLTNKPTSIVFYDPRTSKEVGVRDSLLAGYVQDDWRISSNLTINLGLRYEMLTNPTEVHGGFGSVSNLYTGTFQLYKNYWQRNPTTRQLRSPSRAFLGPFHDGRTAIRSAFGIFDVLPLPAYLEETICVLPLRFSLAAPIKRN